MPSVLAFIRFENHNTVRFNYYIFGAANFECWFSMCTAQHTYITTGLIVWQSERANMCVHMQIDMRLVGVGNLYANCIRSVTIIIKTTDPSSLTGLPMWIYTLFGMHKSMRAIKTARCKKGCSKYTHTMTMDVVCLQKQFTNSQLTTTPYRCHNDEGEEGGGLRGGEGLSDSGRKGEGEKGRGERKYMQKSSTQILICHSVHKFVHVYEAWLSVSHIGVELFGNVRF